MINFTNASYVKLHLVPDDSFSELITPMFASGERILSSYQTIRDGVVFTDKRIIAINIQGITGKKKDFTSLPYNRIQVFSVETAGVLDLDSELELYFSGLGVVRFEFESCANIYDICKTVSENVFCPANT